MTSDNKDVRIEENIYKSRNGYRVYARETDPTTGRSRKVPRRFGPEVTLAELRAYRDAVQGAKGAQELTGFLADTQRYRELEQVKAMPALKTRLIELAKWDEIFGTTPRAEIDARLINDKLYGLRKTYSGSTVNKFRTALMSVWTLLDGRSAANPVKETDMFEEAEMTPRGQSYDLLTRILDDINDERGMNVDRGTLFDEVWSEPSTVVARRYGVSSSFLKRVCESLAVPTPPRGFWSRPVDARPPRPALARGVKGRTSDLLKSRARLEVLLWTGMDAGQLMRMDPDADLDLVKAQYRPPLRQKGQSRRRRTPRPRGWLPLVPEAVEAFQRLIAVEGWGAFSAQSLLKVWKRACRRVEARLRKEYNDPHFRIPNIRIKDLRHSFGTLTFEKTRDLDTVRDVLTHAPGSPMARRYALGAVPSVLRSRMSKVTAGMRRNPPTAKPGRVPTKAVFGTKVVPISRKH
jgi:integrase